MSSPVDASSPVDSRDPEKNVLPVSSGTDSLSVRRDYQGWSQVRDLRSESRQPATRSLFASVCIIAACTSSMMMNIALGPAVAISLPYAGKDLHIQKGDLQWIVNAYSISSACFLLPCGRLADLYGRKLVWLVGYLTMAVFGLGSGFADAGIMLDILRGFQGIGAAAMIPASLGILARAFPPGPARSIAFSTFSAGAPVGAVFGTVLGSFLIQSTSPTWRTPLYSFSSVSFVCILLGYFAIDKDEPSTEEDKRIDWIGAILITSGLILIVFVLSDSPTARRGWKNPRVISLFIVGVVLVLLFAAWQYYLEWRLENPDLPRTRWTAPPLMKLSMWARAHGRFAVIQIIVCVNWAAFTSWIVWVQLYYQTYLNLTPIHTMLRVLPMFFMGIVANITIALIIGRIDAVYIIAVGTLMTGCANIFFAVIDPNATYWAFGFPSACLIVLGADFTFASGTLFISKISPPHEQSVAGALFQAMARIGSAIGLGVSTVVFNSVLRAQSRRLGVSVDREGDNAPMEAQLKAYKAAMWMGFAFGVLCTMLCVFLRGVGVVGRAPTLDSTVTSHPQIDDPHNEKRNDLETNQK
ncbi:putative efflux transporter [Lactifluus subvellereus]|nr:putative efflux transporter [Lactifluus subvellereus]